VKTARARITAIQEDRLLLARDDGRVLQLTVAHDSPVSDRDLRAWYRAGSRLVVEFDGEPNLATGVLHRARAAA
jgi:hypothetical protein